MKVVALAAALSMAVAACEAAPRQLPELNFDTGRLGLSPVPAGAPQPLVSPRQAISIVQEDYRVAIRPTALGRRWTLGDRRTAWVVAYELPAAGDDDCTPCARVIDDQTGAVMFTFDQGTLRALQILRSE